MKKILTLLFLATAFSSFGQSKQDLSINANSSTKNKTSSSAVTSFVANSFGGDMELFENLLQNLGQPDNLGADEKVTIEYLFVIDADGSIKEILEIPDSSNPDWEVRQIMNEIPLWSADAQNINNTSMYFILPVTFVSE